MYVAKSSGRILMIPGGAGAEVMFRRDSDADCIVLMGRMDGSNRLPRSKVTPFRWGASNETRIRRNNRLTHLIAVEQPQQHAPGLEIVEGQQAG